jgi:hypothetical protein
VARTVFLHVGLAKTGTTYLQRILDSNRELMRRNGVLYPGKRRADHFKAVLDLRGTTFQGHTYAGSAGAWQRLVGEVDRYDGAAVISHETMARVRRPLIDETVAGFATDDVRVVMTARDLARQVPAIWQERLKNRSVETYSHFLESVFASEHGRNKRGLFWEVQDLIGLTKRWGAVVGSDNVTIVTVPASGGDPRELWRRFARALELPDLPYDLVVQSRNASLGVVEAELLRLLNPRLPELTWPEYEYRIKHRFAELNLASYQTAGRLTVPKEWHDDVQRISEKVIAFLEQSGCRVIGDLTDLTPQLREPFTDASAGVDDAVVLDLALRVLGRYAAQPERPGGRRSPRAGRSGRADRVAGLIRRAAGRIGRG